MGETIVMLPVEGLQQFMVEVFTAVGVPEEDARISAGVLIASDLRGIESHGVGRLRMYVERIQAGQHRAVTEFEIVRETPTTAVVDGHHGMGMVIGHRAMNLAIEKARRFGMGAVAVRNSTHFGIAGYYPLMAVQAGMIGITVTNARPSIAPTFSVQPKLGTNPIAFGAPTDEDCPFLFDAATSIIQRGKIEVLERKGLPSKPGWVIRSDGSDALDAAQILKDLTRGEAALLPLGGEGELYSGHKGYGLATLVEILSAALQQGSFLSHLSGLDPDGKPAHLGLGHFFMAMDISAFCAPEAFKRSTGEILRELRAARKAPGQARIFTAGEKEWESERKVRSEGVPVVPALQRDIRFLRESLRLRSLPFAFETQSSGA